MCTTDSRTSTVRVYGPETFCLVLQQKLGLPLVSPDDELLLRVPPQFLRRQVEKGVLADGKNLSFPLFSKPITPKRFRGRVYISHSELAEECKGLPSTTPIFCPSEWNSDRKSAPSFLMALCSTQRFTKAARTCRRLGSFLHALTTSVKLPPTLVVDVGSSPIAAGP